MDFVALIEAEEAAKRKQAATCRDKRPRGTDDTDDTDDVSSPRADKKPRTAAAGDTPTTKKEEEEEFPLLRLGGRISKERLEASRTAVPDNMMRVHRVIQLQNQWRLEVEAIQKARWRQVANLRKQLQTLREQKEVMQRDAARLRQWSQTLYDAKLNLEGEADCLRHQVQTLRDEKMTIEEEAVKLRQQLQALRDVKVVSEQEAAKLR